MNSRDLTMKTADFAIGVAASALSWSCAMTTGPKWLEFLIIPFSLWTALRMVPIAGRLHKTALETQVAKTRRAPAWMFGAAAIGVLLLAGLAHAYIPLVALAVWPTMASGNPWIVGVVLHLSWTAAFVAIAVGASRFKFHGGQP